MNFSPSVVQLSGGDLPPNSVTLVYSPSCPHCHNIMAQYNQLPGLSGGKFTVNAVNLMDHYHELRAGGVTVGGVPQILIRGGSSELLEYNGPRMADSIAKEAFSFIGGSISGGAAETTDALLGGDIPASVTASVPASEPVTAPTEVVSEPIETLIGGAAPAPLTGGRKPGPKRGSHHKHHHRKSRSRSRSRSRSKSRHHHRRMRGGLIKGGVIKGGVIKGGVIKGGEIKGGATQETTPVDVNALEGGSRKRKDHLSRWRNHVMAYAREHNMSLKKAMKKARASYYK